LRTYSSDLTRTLMPLTCLAAFTMLCAAILLSNNNLL
jgi:hypothetical protein